MKLDNIKELLNRSDIKSFIKESWAVSWPMSMIMFFEFLINMTDIFIAGKFGKEVQAAYGVVVQLYFILIVVAISFTVGSVSVISRLFTSNKNNGEFSRAVLSSTFLSILAGAVLGIFGVIFSQRIIYAMNIPPQLKDLGAPLFKIYCVAVLFDYFLINTNGILRSCKLIKSSMITMAIVCALNVILNFCLAFYTPLGFKGIAWATVISLFVGCVLNSVYIKAFFAKSVRFSLEAIKKMVDIGWPSGLLQITWQIGLTVIFLILSKLPENNIETMAAFTNGLRVESGVFLIAFAFNMSNAVIVGNLLGKEMKEEAFNSGIITAVIGVGVVFVLSMAIAFNAKLISLFLSNNPIVIRESIKYIYIALLAEPLMAWGVILGGGLSGAGDTKSVMRIALVSVWLVRIPLSYALVVIFGFNATAVWWSMNASILAQSLLISRRYFKKRWLELA